MIVRHLLRRQGWTLLGGALIIALLIGGLWGLCASPARASDVAQDATATLPPRYTPTPEPTTPTPEPPTATPEPPTATPDAPTVTPTPSTGESPPEESSEPTVTPTYVLLPNSGQTQSGTMVSEGVIIGALLLAGAVILGAYVARRGWGN